LVAAPDLRLDLRFIALLNCATANFGKPSIPIHTAFKSAAAFFASSLIDTVARKTRRFAFPRSLSPLVSRPAIHLTATRRFPAVFSFSAFLRDAGILRIVFGHAVEFLIILKKYNILIVKLVLIGCDVTGVTGRFQD
jgi:hypothetical protein